MQIDCEYVHELFVNDDNGYSVIIYRFTGAGENCPVPEGKEFTAVGYYLSRLKKTKITLTGEWKRDAKHGLQFAAKECSETVQKSREGIVGFLSSGMIKGIGKGLAGRIYGTFGENTLEIMDSDIERLVEVPGISARKMKKIKESYAAVCGSRKFISFLASYGIQPAMAKKIYEKKISLEEIKKNPYILLDVNGISFQTADEIGLGTGLSSHFASRIRAAILCCLKQTELAGHCGSPQTPLVNSAKKMLNCTVRESRPVTAEEIMEQTELLVKEKQVIRFKGVYYRDATYWCECDIAKEIKRLSQHPAKPIERIEEKLKSWEENNSISFDGVQKEAVITALSHGFSVITGGPGRGKTTVTKAIADIRCEASAGISLMAPTGRAARRLAGATGMAASTIHSALQINDDEKANEGCIIQDGQLLVDETSMLDIWLCRTLLQAVQDGCNVTFIGDVNQLPSVRAGAVLRDIIASGMVPVVELKTVYRQSEGSTIAANSERINDGNTDLVMNDEFQCYRAETGKEAARAMIALYKSKCRQYGRGEVALLSPFHHAKSDASSDSINRYLQEILNPAASGKKETVYRKHVFRTGDVVMQVKNKNDICNGDIGTITGIYMDDGDLMTEVTFDESGTVYSYSEQEMELLELAYCLTYHKVQGSEYKCVIATLLQENKRMLKRNLFYTGVTRAKEEFIFVGSPSALNTAVETVDSDVRITLLKEKIIYVFTKDNPFIKKTA